MPTPTLTIRIAPEHHDILREVAARLKADASLPDRLRAALQPAQQPAEQGQPDILSRIEVLEAHVAELRGKAGRRTKVSDQERRLIVAAGLDGVMTRLQYAAHIGVSNATLTRWVKRGMPLRDDGLLDIKAVETWRKANEARILAEKVKPGRGR